MRITSAEATNLLDLLDAGNLDEIRNLVKPHVFTSHKPKEGDKIQFRSPKVTGWSDEHLVLSVIKDGDGDEVMILSVTENDGTKKVVQKYVNQVQIRPAQPRRQRKSEAGKGAAAESNGETPAGEPERVVPTKAPAKA